MRPPRARPTQPAAARSAAWPVGLLVALCFTTLPLFLALSPGRPSLLDLWQQLGIRVTVHYGTTRSCSLRTRDVLLGGLLSPDVDEASCRSRYLSSLHRAPSPHAPSPYLVSRLRKYEALHRRCGPGTPSYDKSVRQLASARHSMGLAECRYFVWTPPGPGGDSHHLADRVLSMASAFLYALLTRRVFLVDMSGDMAGLFCEPFPGATWELPPAAGFPAQNLTRLRRGGERSYGSLLASRKVGTEDPAGVRSESLPSYAYLHLARDYQLPDQLFFCDADQTVLGKVNLLVLRSNLYFAPGLFLVPQFEDELRWMFPAPDTVFHHVGRYLFHPSNEVWKIIAGYYASYMAKFDERIGIQITARDRNPVPAAEAYLKQVTACTSQEKILPEIDPDAASTDYEAAATAKAVLVSSAQPEYAERLRSMYYEHATVTGESVSVLPQPGGAGKRPQNNQKLLVEMFLHSYCNVSVVSSWSTVGYVGHGLAGVRPWLLLPPPPRNQTVANPPCVRATSMEPCFHAPPSYDCRAKKNGDLGAVLRYVRHCEDADDGLKLFD
ncbi:galactoside 2-alpha-L-fucosyltransferase-like [Panicum virgatum]|uniref:galactoside 2-alpha-L-fucosyltransferase-like n=1 Tax=Panicum virgatum TaxID=38727 RepID=UPI0019D58D9C|nr:galactoside 2-alpha-L-fucosyltransferase-like [Panicum virgatum]